ncbi:MAG TPA: hypothetical protein VNX46_01865, partial [Candidatus Acidoferrum sp.]|nr:hypothetical protein [Candidatus Acidoferrum sp.]
SLINPYCSQDGNLAQVRFGKISLHGYFLKSRKSKMFMPLGNHRNENSQKGNGEGEAQEFIH